MRPRMSFALVVSITLPGGVCVQRNFIYILVLDAAAGGLCCTSFLFGFSQRGPSAHRPACGGLCEDPELSVRTVWFDMNGFEGLKQTPSIHTTPAGCVKNHIGICGLTFERRPCARRVRPMPHNPEAGSASQEKAIEEAIDPPFFGRLRAAFFGSKKKYKINKFF